LCLAAPARLFALPRKTCLMPGVSLGEFAVQTLEFEDLTLLAANLICDRSTLAPVLICEDVVSPMTPGQMQFAEIPFSAFSTAIV
jgi:hypothetical protein